MYNSIEIWKYIEGYEGKYQVSNTGKIRSLCYHDGGHGVRRPKLMKPGTDESGYYRCALSKNNELRTFKVHRLVAKAFIPNPSNKPQVNHIDGNKKNNYVSNLEWVTSSENQIHAWKNGLQPKFRKRKLYPYLNEILRLLEIGYNPGAISILFGCGMGEVKRFLVKHGYEHAIKNASNGRSKPIIAVGEKGTFRFKSIRDAANNGYDYHKIQRAIKSNKAYDGMTWKHVQLPPLPANVELLKISRL